MSTATKIRPAQWGLTLVTLYMATFVVIAFWPQPALDIAPATQRQPQGPPSTPSER